MAPPSARMSIPENAGQVKLVAQLQERFQRRVMAEAARETPPALPDVNNPVAVALGRPGPTKGGKPGTARLMPEWRSRIAERAGETRWARRSG